MRTSFMTPATRALALTLTLALTTGCSISVGVPSGRAKPQPSPYPERGMDTPAPEGRQAWPEEPRLDPSERIWAEQAAGSRGTAVPLDSESFVRLAETAGPAVVNIYTEQVVRGAMPLPGDIFGVLPFRIPIQRRGRSLGSGFIINPQGYILTNNHVVADADQIKVVLSGGEKVFSARVIGRAPKTDIALIRIYADGTLPTLPLGRSAELRIGEVAVAIGNPFGLSHTMTSGIVSGTGRTLGLGPLDDFIQTDTPINPGNSGGPLLNLRGEVIGINTAVIPYAQGIGFAIPVDIAKDLLPRLQAGQVVHHSWLGLSVAPVDAEEAGEAGLEAPRGARVREVAKGGPADRAGILEGDIILKVDGRTIDEARELPLYVANLEVGAPVELTLVREGQTIVVESKTERWE